MAAEAHLLSGELPMQQPDHAERKAAIKRGIEFIYRTAREPKNFELYGYDYLSCFHCIASTSKDRALSRMAMVMGQERARKWRQLNSDVPPDADAEAIANLVFGSEAADRLGVRDKQLKAKLRKAAARFAASDYLWFDATTEPPPTDVPEECPCGVQNPRGRKRCSECKRQLTMLSSYGVWMDALTRSYIGERHGVRLGASYAEVIKWLPSMRPYPVYVEDDDWHYYWAMYAVTHVVYTLNDYSFYTVSPRWLPDEFTFLKRNLTRTLAMNDSETLGEFLDTLKSFGLGEEHPLILKGVNYLVTHQNPDGSWGDPEAEDIYQRYHPTWTAIDGLREYAWHGESPRFREFKFALKRGDRPHDNAGF
jgi:hypothetical protein